MFARSMGARGGVRGLKSAQIARNSAVRAARWYATNQAPRPKIPGKLVALLGVLAVGSTFVSISYNKVGPKEFLEPVQGDEQRKSAGSGTTRAFKDGQVKVIFVLGGPGAGKGTQCAKLVRDYNFVHLSAGDLLRAEQARPGSQYGELIDKYIREGNIVPQEITIALLEKAMREKYDNGLGSNRFLVDGFPRKMDQAITFEDQVAVSSFTLFFDCPEATMLKRLLERGKTSGRADDNVESIKKRFKTFVETSYPVVQYYEKQNKVVKVSCDHPVDQVYAEVQAAIKEKMDIH